VAIARGADKEALARELGAHHYIDNETQDVASALQALGGAKVVLASETTDLRDLLEEYTSTLRRAGLDEATAHFVANLDASIAVCDLETKTDDDLAHLLGHPAPPLPDSVRMTYDRLISTSESPDSPL
jgi:Zn-dependent alcohol dehydrogenase